MDDPELRRYIEHLQSTLLWPGAEELFDHERHREWLTTNAKRLIHRGLFGRDEAAVDEYARLVNEFVPETSFDVFSPGAIFGPILRSQIELLPTFGLSLKSPVAVRTSTALDVTPYARPATGGHQLFIGLGTSSFCNYWAKCFASLASALAALDTKTGPSSSADILTALRVRPEIGILATRLALYYAVFGTLVQFGEVDIRVESEGYRVELLIAMEQFVIGHELGHFLITERESCETSALGDEDVVALERECDMHGFAISQGIGAQTNNCLAFTGAGALVFFWAMQMCVDARALRPGIEEPKGLYPSFAQRRSWLRECLTQSVEGDERTRALAYFDDVDGICQALHGHVISVARQVLDEPD